MTQTVHTQLARRNLLVSAIGAAIGGPALIAARAPGAQSPVECPKMDMDLTRKLTRGLRDGEAIRVTRQWRISFAPQGRGIAISGSQTMIEVDAPKVLAPIAEIEESRSTAYMFPIMLTADGTIAAVGDQSAVSRTTSFDEAVARAQDLFRKNGLSPEETAMHTAYLVRIQQAGTSMLDVMPGDLFYPSSRNFREERTIDLPDGSKGAFEISWEASVQPGTNLLSRARREIITKIGADTRRSAEQWTLAPV